jgi:hypothetical protein
MRHDANIEYLKDWIEQTEEALQSHGRIDITGRATVCFCGESIQTYLSSCREGHKLMGRIWSLKGIIAKLEEGYILQDENRILRSLLSTALDLKDNRDYEQIANILAEEAMIFWEKANEEEEYNE